MSVRVMVVDDFPMVRDGIVLGLARDPAIDVVGTADDGAEALQKAPELRPDVMLVDLHMPELGGIMLIERLQPELSDTKFIVLTASEKGDSLLAAVSAGAKGYLTKRSTPAELVSAVLTVHGGGSVIAPSLAGHLFDAYARGAAGDSEQLRPKLTGAEQEVLRLLTQGLTDRQIAERLYISPRTVQNHLAHVRQKTNLSRRSELARWAVVHAVY